MGNFKPVSFYIDIGHGELLNGRPDPGAVKGNLIEHQMNIVTANALAQRLLAHGHEVKVEQGNLPINQSANAANAYGADYCISCHYNAGGGDRGEVLYSWDDKAFVLANIIGNGLKVAGQSVVNVVKSKAGEKDPNHEFFGMLRIPKMPAVIIEPCFIDNMADRTLADNQAKQAHVGVCIADAIAAAFGSNLDSSFNNVMDKLAIKGMVASPQYWKDAVATGADIDGAYMASLIEHMTGISNIATAVAKLASLGAIAGPEYWNTNCVSGHTVKSTFAKTLIVNAVEKLKL